MKAKEHTCCFFGHRKIEVTEELVNRLKEVVEDLIVEKKVDTFLFGSKSQFDKLALSVVTELKKKYPHIKRIYVRAEFPYIDEDYTAYLLKRYDHTYYPERMINAGKAAYVERNYEMIEKSNYCVIYYDENYMPPKGKSCVRLALGVPKSRQFKLPAFHFEMIITEYIPCLKLMLLSFLIIRFPK